MIINKLLRKFFVFTVIFFLIIILTIIFFNLFLKIAKPNTIGKDKVGTSSLALNSSDKSGNNFPFPLSLEQIDQSLMQNQGIIIKPVEFSWPEEINDSLLKNGWKLIGLSRALDGGSVIYYYFKTKDSPALSLSYHWDMIKGKYLSLGIDFIHPARIGAWLINNKAYFVNNDVDIESLMDCQGIIYEAHPGVTECIKK